MLWPIDHAISSKFSADLLQGGAQLRGQFIDQRFEEETFAGHKVYFEASFADGVSDERPNGCNQRVTHTGGQFIF